MKNILICGATGFIGRNLVHYFSSKNSFQVHAVKHKKDSYKVPNACNKVIWHDADLLSLDDVSRVLKNVDIVIQAAATTSGAKDIVNRPYIHVTDNAIMNSLLLRQAMEYGVKHFIFFSCTVMYQSSQIPIRESDWSPSQTINERYFGVANTKIYIEKMLEFYANISDMKTTAIRHSNIYGPYDKFDLERSHVFGATITKVLKAKESIVVWGTGEEERDLLYIDDLCNFTNLAITNQKSRYRLYNCGLGKSISIKSLVHKIVNESSKNLDINHDTSKPTIKTSLSLNCSLAKDELGWEPNTTLEDGIKKTINWWKNNIDPSTLLIRSESTKN